MFREGIFRLLYIELTQNQGGYILVDSYFRRHFFARSSPNPEISCSLKKTTKVEERPSQRFLVRGHTVLLVVGGHCSDWVAVKLLQWVVAVEEEGK